MYATAALCLWLAAFGCLVNVPFMSVSHGLSGMISPALQLTGYNASLYISLPMLTLTLLDLKFDWRWQKATWGRIFLALAALFELLRRAETSFGLMLSNGLGYTFTHPLLINAAVMTLMGIYLYRAAASMALDSPAESPK